MKISSNDLINLPVFTQSGQNLGRVYSFDLDIDNNAVVSYYVRTGLIKGLWHQQLIISPRQVISISKEKMVVEDSAAKEPKASLGKVELVGSGAD
ncbi:MAG: hypothetical protein A3J65_03640 [Candidatus Buchananbacteria bacterium RIFCSPHIGHO2_02_FULL_45_11b]|uniref:PRC-barrel domain-containing protein n=4 Tax=Candidatus Buchananiibacteriota TaxID=1817903 RepID=A0A1G1YEQ1_9BACT|nr:MAG: hypothetical protein A2663_03380 [Candidatus Buchananbacteria bacterium RIFCSPHIGHO2_01_FULL_46_12]OGY50759.1 MAG: hypothetical protein A3J65_03640 [Candidatus Buchananbacteria bacterium RIFCSPHIGHO2_02_FULL_45_11b]OGY53305.1 MAG: hypothetical protein A3B15_03190 [Candidatus Buchananbacteria bacterium RIFCSPLOWO2_01_FULL_45_31]OGY55752.1 MAG: hypothetical protein A3H67_02535 [Candidatus Buchananbacteria bacterium RIFCSPLOWO2_02_FULL_46_11b]